MRVIVQQLGYLIRELVEVSSPGSQDHPRTVSDVLHNACDADVQQIASWNEMSTHPSLSIPKPLCVHELVSNQAHLNPKAPAVHAWNGQLTFSARSTLAQSLWSRCGVSSWRTIREEYVDSRRDARGAESRWGVRPIGHQSTYRTCRNNIVWAR